MSTVLERPSLERKAQEVEALVKLIDRYDVLVVASLYKVRSMQLQALSRKLRNDVQMRVTKNSILRRALGKSGKQGAFALGDALAGPNVLLLTDMNPFSLSILLKRSKIRMTAKAGDSAPDDIVITAGNTGLPPGPAISELHDAGIRTRIESGSVYVLQDTIVAKRGEQIQPRVASVLSKLGIKPLEVGLNIIAAYDNGLVLKEEDLRINLEDVQKELESAFGQAFTLSLNVTYPTPENITLILQSAQTLTRNLALNSSYATSESAPLLLAKAYRSMVGLSNQIAKANKAAAPLEFQS